MIPIMAVYPENVCMRGRCKCNGFSAMIGSIAPERFRLRVLAMSTGPQPNRGAAVPLLSGRTTEIEEQLS